MRKLCLITITIWIDNIKELIMHSNGDHPNSFKIVTTKKAGWLSIGVSAGWPCYVSMEVQGKAGLAEAPQPNVLMEFIFNISFCKKTVSLTFESLLWTFPRYVSIFKSGNVFYIFSLMHFVVVWLFLKLLWDNKMDIVNSKINT